MEVELRVFLAALITLGQSVSKALGHTGWTYEPILQGFAPEYCGVETCVNQENRISIGIEFDSDGEVEQDGEIALTAIEE